MSSTLVVLACLAIIMLISLIALFMITGYCSNGQKVTVTPIAIQQSPSIQPMDNIHTKQHNEGVQTITNTISQTPKQSHISTQQMSKSREKAISDTKPQNVSNNHDINITPHKQSKPDLKPSESPRTNKLNPNAAEFTPFIASNTKSQQIKQQKHTQKQVAIPQQTDAKQPEYTQNKLHPSPTSTQQQLQFNRHRKLDHNQLLRHHQHLKYQQCLNYYFFNDINI